MEQDLNPILSSIKKLNSKLCCIKKDLDSEVPVTLTYDGETGELTLTDQHGTDTTVILPLEQFLSQASYDNNTNILTLTMSDGTSFSIDLADLVDAATPPGGSNTQIQYNNAGAFAGSSQLIANIGATNTLDITGSGNNSSTNSFRIRNSDLTQILSLQNNGGLNIRDKITIGYGGSHFNELRGGPIFQIVNSTSGGALTTDGITMDTAHNVGISNTGAISARLDIQGSGSTSATNALRVRNSSGTNLLTIANNGNIGIGVNPTTSILDIRNANSNSNSINIGGTNSNVGNFISIHGSSSDGLASYIYSNYFTTEGSLIFGTYTNRLNQLVLLKTGLVGLSVTLPLAGLHNAINTTASTPSMLLSGTGYSGGTSTTTKPTLLIEPTGTTSTGWSTSGTKLGVNAESGFSGNLLDLQVNGLSLFRINPTAGQVNAVNATSNTFVIGSVGYTSGMRVFSSSGSGATYIDGWSDGASKASNYDIVIGSRVNNTGVNLTGSTTAENGTNVQIGFDATSNPRALLSLNSTTRGFLPTRMTTTQRDAVTWVTGDAGMMIFNSTLIKLQVWNGSAWETVTSL